MHSLNSAKMQWSKKQSRWKEDADAAVMNEAQQMRQVYMRRLTDRPTVVRAYTC